jgi:hypothetical protein
MNNVSNSIYNVWYATRYISSIDALALPKYWTTILLALDETN